MSEPHNKRTYESNIRILDIQVKTATGLYYGNIDSEVGTILQQKLKQFPNFASALVLSVDSTIAPVDILSIMSNYGIDARLEPGGSAAQPRTS